MSQVFNRKIKHMPFKAGDLVLRKIMTATKKPSEGKLGTNWEGPYKITEAVRPGTYRLETLSGKPLPHPWNVEHMKNEREVLPPNSEATGEVVARAATPAAHGIEITVEFKPLEHPSEPLDSDRPIQCPLPDPSIFNDGRIWREQVSADVRRRPNLPLVMQEGNPLEPMAAGTKPRSPSNRSILPSISAPEHSILQLPEECSASEI